MYLTGSKALIEPQLHPLNRRALDLIPLFFNQVTQDHPPFMLIVYYCADLGGLTRKERDYLIRAVIRIYASIHKIHEMKRKKDNENIEMEARP